MSETSENVLTLNESKTVYLLHFQSKCWALFNTDFNQLLGLIGQQNIF